MTEVPLIFGGCEIHCIPPTTVRKKVLRTWKERLSVSKDELFFFNPFNKYKEVEEYRQLLQDDKTIVAGNKIYCNENTFQLFKKELENVCSITFEKHSSYKLGDVYSTEINFKTGE